MPEAPSATRVHDPARSVNPDQADGNKIIEGERTTRASQYSLIYEF